MKESVCLVERKQQNIFNIFDKYYNRRVAILEFFVEVIFLKFLTYQTTGLGITEFHLKENWDRGRNKFILKVIGSSLKSLPSDINL